MNTKAEIKDEFVFPDEQDTTQKEVEVEAAAQPKEDFQIEVEDDTPPADRGRKAMATPPEEPTEDELSTYDEKVQARIKKFTKGYHDERREKERAIREREAAETFAKQVYEENKRLQQQLVTGSQAYIEQSKSSAQIALDIAKSKYKEAYEAGDADKVVAAQEDIARATLRLEQAQHMRPVEEREIPTPQYTPPTPSVPRLTRDWAERNSDWFGKDEEMTSAAMGLDRKLQREYGADFIGTEDYFKVIDRTMRKRFPEYFDGTGSQEEDEEPPKKSSRPAQEEEPPRRAKSSTVVAPAARSTPPNRIKLKASEVDVARRLGVPIELYAKQVAQLRKGE